jgi:hypothetical protein
MRKILMDLRDPFVSPAQAEKMTTREVRFIPLLRVTAALPD